MNFSATGRGVAGIKMLFSLLGICGGLLVLPGFGASQADGAIFRPGAHKFQQKTGVFEVSIKGVQFNQWRQDRQPEWECDVSSKGSGWERAWFHTPPRRMRVSAFGEGKADSAIFKPIPVRGKVTRQGKLKRGPSSSLPEHCFADGGGTPGPPPPGPDCGTKKLRGAKLSPFALDGDLTLGLTLTRKEAPKLYRNCAYIGKVWPSLLERRGNGSKIAATFGPNRVYNQTLNRRTGKRGQVKFTARGNAIGRSLGTWYKTKIRWTITMKRIR